VLGQSYNKGWTASINGHDLGAPQLVDGYANGWLVQPNADGSPVSVHIDWSPQHGVFDAILISALATLACIAIVLVSLVRGRRREYVAADDSPEFRTDLRAGLRIDRRVLVIVFAVSALTAFVVQPVVGLAFGCLTLFGLRGGWRRTALVLAPVALMLGITLYVAMGQAVGHYPPRFEWPGFFDIARIPAWIALILLFADAALTQPAAGLSSQASATSQVHPRE
jgi:hypothetical protein